MPNIIGPFGTVQDRAQEVNEAQLGKDILTMLGLYTKMPVESAIGAAVAVLIEVAHSHRKEFTRAMREPVHKDGFTGISVLELFRRQSQ